MGTIVGLHSLCVTWAKMTRNNLAKIPGCWDLTAKMTRMTRNNFAKIPKCFTKIPGCWDSLWDLTPLQIVALHSLCVELFIKLHFPYLYISWTQVTRMPLPTSWTQVARMPLCKLYLWCVCVSALIFSLSLAFW